MLASVTSKVDMAAVLKPALFYLKQPARVIRAYDNANLRADIIAGITVAVVALPQAIAFTLIADLPPKMGLYATIVGAIIGALWGSSNQGHTGPPTPSRCWFCLPYRRWMSLAKNGLFWRPA